ncbi:MAG: hypothetical protein ACYTX0_36255 [Nostoc sp.]
MSTKPPPPPRRPNKGEPPSIDETKSNLEKPEPGETANLNFKVPAEQQLLLRLHHPSLTKVRLWLGHDNI